MPVAVARSIHCALPAISAERYALRKAAASRSGSTASMSPLAAATKMLVTKRLTSHVAGASAASSKSFRSK